MNLFAKVDVKPVSALNSNKTHMHKQGALEQDPKYANQPSLYATPQVKKQMYIAKGVLDTIQTISPHAIIAGGAPHSWNGNTLANDVDIFFSLDVCTQTHADSLRNSLRLLENLLPDATFKVLGVDTRPETNPDGVVGDDAFNNYMMNPNVRHVFEFEHRGVTFQLIVINTIELDVARFAFNICQTWSDGYYVWSSPIYQLGVAKRILVQTGHLYGSSDKYKQKILDRHKGWVFISIKEQELSPLLFSVSSTPTYSLVMQLI